MRKRRRKRKPVPELDLHGVRHAQAGDVVEDFVLDHQCDMVVITGHSEEMKRIVKDVLDRHGFKYLDGVPGNAGVIWISG